MRIVKYLSNWDGNEQEMQRKNTSYLEFAYSILFDYAQELKLIPENSNTKIILADVTTKYMTIENILSRRKPPLAHLNETV